MGIGELGAYRDCDSCRLFCLPSVVEILMAFRSFDIAKLIMNLWLVTLEGMIVAYLVHSDTRRVFEEPQIELRLN